MTTRLLLAGALILFLCSLLVLFPAPTVHHGVVGAAIAGGILAFVCIVPSVMTAVLSRCVGYSNWAVVTVLYAVSLDALARLLHRILA